MLKNSKKQSHVYMFSLAPLLLVLTMLVGVGTGSYVLKDHVVRANSQVVLGDEDEGDENKDEDSKDEEESNEDEDEKKDESAKKAEEQQREAQKKAMERQRELDKKAKELEKKRLEKEEEQRKYQLKLNSMQNASDSDENEMEDDDSLEGKENEKSEIVSVVTNPDGTTTRIIKKIEDDGEVEMKSLTYDENGVLVKKAELNADGTIKEEEIINDERNSDSDDKDGDELENETETLTQEKLFGIFNINTTEDVVVDPVTGEITSVNQSFWNKVISFFSF